jgi:hypothetical protein
MPKAFDLIWQTILLSKYGAIGLGKYFITRISNYLSNRSVQVLVADITSDTYKINAGVSQGSILYPKLFKIFRKDILFSTYNTIHTSINHTFKPEWRICCSFFIFETPRHKTKSLYLSH